MTEVKLENVSQLLKKTVKSDGRIGGLQQYCDEEVCVVIYDKESGDV